MSRTRPGVAALACLWLTLPLAAVAEGNRITVDCERTTTCDGAGTCVEGDHAPQVITFESVGVDTAGIALLNITINDLSFPGTTFDGLVYRPAAQRNGTDILLTGGANWLVWHHKTPEAALTTVDFLTCEAPR